MNGATTIQERLKDLRLNKGLKLEELAEQTGISKSALGSYEKDDYKEINHGNLNCRHEQKLSYHLYRCKREQNICPILHLSKQANMEEQQDQYCQPTGSSRPEYGVLFQIHFSGLLRCL